MENYKEDDSEAPLNTAEVEEQKIRRKPVECLDTELKKLAYQAGMSCQYLFVRSYVQAGQSDTFARAVFARYMSTAPANRVLPEVVRKYALGVKKKGVNGHHYKHGFCSGCMLTDAGIAGMEYAYSLIHPDSVLTDLQAQPESALEDSAIERLYDKLYASGALGEGQDLNAGDNEGTKPEWEERF